MIRITNRGLRPLSSCGHRHLFSTSNDQDPKDRPDTVHFYKFQRVHLKEYELKGILIKYSHKDGYKVNTLLGYKDDPLSAVHLKIFSKELYSLHTIAINNGRFKLYHNKDGKPMYNKSVSVKGVVLAGLIVLNGWGYYMGFNNPQPVVE